MIVDPMNEIQDESLSEVLRNEMLISEIQKREPLWNFKISVAERGRHTIQKLWEEVVSAMNGMLIKYNYISWKQFTWTRCNCPQPHSDQYLKFFP